MFKKILVVRNPSSGRGKKIAYVDKVVSALRALGCDVTVYDTQCAGDGISYLLSLEEEFDVIVAAGGDGTVNEVINGMVHKVNTPLALIPAGTTNVLAKELGLPRRAASLAKVIAQGLSKPVHLGRLNGKRFAMMVGVGYDAWVVNEVNLDIKQRFGKLAYVISMFREVLNFGKQRYLAEVDGRVIECGSMIITQGKYYAGSFIISKQADLSKPSMQVLIVATRSRLKFLLVVLAMPMSLMEKLPFVQSVAARKLRIKTETPNPRLDVLQMDGDPAGVMPAELEIETKAISMLVAQ